MTVMFGRGWSVASAALLLNLLPHFCWSFIASSPPGLGCPSLRQQNKAVVTQQQLKTSPTTRCVNTAMVADSSVDRGDFLRGAVGAAAVVATVAAKPEKAAAIGIAGIQLPFLSDKIPSEVAKVTEVAEYSNFVNKLEQDLRTGALKGGIEDSVVVSKVLENYLKPMQELMLSAAPVLQLAGRETRDRVKLLPLIMKGHLLELEEACRTKNAKDQLQETQEVKETLDEFISLAKTRYEVNTSAPGSSPEGDQLGIFGCSFYGMKRKEGTNTCQPDP